MVGQVLMGEGVIVLCISGRGSWLAGLALPLKHTPDRHCHFFACHRQPPFFTRPTARQPPSNHPQGTIEGRRDIRGGRLASDRRAAANSSSGAAFTSLAFSADGSLLLAGGASKHVCLYDVAERVLLRRFTLSHNRCVAGFCEAGVSVGVGTGVHICLCGPGDMDTHMG